jgi:hypothetical protein
VSGCDLLEKSVGCCLLLCAVAYGCRLTMENRDEILADFQACTGIEVTQELSFVLF